MLSPRAIHLLLKYFDSIDELLARRLLRKRIWDEEALTFLLTDLLDEESQRDHKIKYSHVDLVADLSRTDEPISIDVTLDTHSYPKSVERYVTQSDIGFILSYQDQFDHQKSFQYGWLMQAKRLFPSKRKFEQGFTENSKFESFDRIQHDRMKRLRDWANCDFIRYMLYCPRPSSLDTFVRERLSAARSHAIGPNIFDYALGLELRDDLLSEKPTTAAGIFIALIDDFPETLLKVHSQLFGSVSPFSWFIVSHLAQTDGLLGIHRIRYSRRSRSGPHTPDNNLNNPTINGLIRGDYSVIEKDKSLVQILEDASRATILPAHTLSIRVINGIDRPRIKNNG